MTTQVLEDVKIHHISVDLPDLNPYDETEPSDGADHRTHIVNPEGNEHILPVTNGKEMQELVDIARFTEQEIVALCGYKWIPKRNPEKFDLCEACRLRAEQIMQEMGE